MKYYINDKGQKVKRFQGSPGELKPRWKAKQDWFGYAFLFTLGVLIISTIILLMQQLK